MFKQSICLFFCFMMSYSTLSAESIKNEARDAYNEGYRFFRNGHYEDSLEQFEQAVYLEPNFSDAHHMIGLIYYKQAQQLLKKSAKAQAKALRNDPLHISSLRDQGALFIQMGEMKKAYTNYQMLQKLHATKEAEKLREELHETVEEISWIGIMP